MKTIDRKRKLEIHKY